MGLMQDDLFIWLADIYGHSTLALGLNRASHCSHCLPSSCPSFAGPRGEDAVGLKLAHDGCQINGGRVGEKLLTEAKRNAIKHNIPKDLGFKPI